MLGCPGHGWRSIYNSSKTVLGMEGVHFLAPWDSFLGQMDTWDRPGSGAVPQPSLGTCDQRPAYAPLPSSLMPWLHKPAYAQTTLTGSERQRYQQQEQEHGLQCSRVWRTRHGSVRTLAVRLRDAVPALGAGLPSLLAPRFCERGSSTAAAHRRLPPSPRAAPTLSHQGPGRRPPTPKRTDGRTPLLLLYGEGGDGGGERGHAPRFPRARGCSTRACPPAVCCPRCLEEGSAQDNGGSCRHLGGPSIYQKKKTHHFSLAGPPPHRLQKPQVKSYSKT